jgi:hypothetical protein
MTLPVKWFANSQGGAPRCSGTAGDMIALLDACLINGFNLLTPSSIVVVAGVATAFFAAPHGFLQHQVILVAGASPSALNGEARVVSVGTNSLTFATTAADGAASGAISVKAAPLGWEKVYSVTNKAAYRSSDVAGNRLYLRVDDTGTTSAAVRGYESMTDVDTGTSPFPTTTQAATFLWPKSNVADTNARGWKLIGDGRFFWLMVAHDGNYGSVWGCVAFGEFPSWKPGDGYATLIFGLTAMGWGTPTSLNGVGSQPGGVGYLARNYNQTTQSVAFGMRGHAQCDTGPGGPNCLAHPNPVDNGFLLYGPITLVDLGVGTVHRGVVPGILHPITNVSAISYSEAQTATDASGNPFLFFIQGFGWNTPGRLAFNITGPWR